LIRITNIQYFFNSNQIIGLVSSWRHEKHQIQAHTIMPYSCIPRLNPTVANSLNFNRTASLTL
jgi:hypothetical protein